MFEAKIKMCEGEGKRDRVKVTDRKRNKGFEEEG